MKTLVRFLFSKGVQTGVTRARSFRVRVRPRQNRTKQMEDRCFYADGVERGSKGRGNDFAALIFCVQENTLCCVMMLERFGRRLFSLRVEVHTKSLKICWYPFIRGCRKTEDKSEAQRQCFRLIVLYGPANSHMLQLFRSMSI